MERAIAVSVLAPQRRLARVRVSALARDRMSVGLAIERAMYFRASRHSLRAQLDAVGLSYEAIAERLRLADPIK